MKKIDAIIFDMDGVLIDSERISFQCYKEVLKEYKYEIAEEFYVKFIGRNVDGIKLVMLEEYGSDFPFDEIYKKKSELAHKTTNENGVKIKTGVHELLDYLNKEKFKIAVATSTRRQRALELLEEAKIKEKVNSIVCGDQVKNSKPDPEIFLKAAEELDVDPKNCLVIEDSDAGIMAAHSAGMTGIHVPDMKVLEEETKKLAFKICEKLIDVKELIKNNKLN
ncbi:HAD-IA family hydrolase [Clostridium chromiireducens]|uniref:HAD-IA family hydrolase n=1 Tax=Clostridium chromiireducens TaxID=225345 RepID=A0A964W1T2_9CLOT|nr:HAD family phosphatase [Clostridium chromiireducens]MVX63579.1 HAD-IA family hydrolase [Clostridium chromiireducens]